LTYINFWNKKQYICHKIKSTLTPVQVTVDANKGAPVLGLRATPGTSRIPTAFDTEFDLLFVLTTLSTENDNEVECKLNKYVREDTYPDHIRLAIFKWRYPQHSHVTTWSECVEIYKTGVNPKS
jgi:hypothetical protein